MMVIKKRQMSLLLGIMIAFLIIHLPLVYTMYYHQLTGAPKVTNGTINMSKIDLSAGKIYLTGEYKFYWNKLIASEETDVSHILVTVPDEWSQHKHNGDVLSAAGYGSYKFYLTDLEYGKPIAILIPDFGSAYRVYIDGIMTAQSGVTSTNLEETFTTPIADLYPVALTGKIHEVIIEVATTRFSGLYMAPVIGDYEELVRENNIRGKIRYVLFGVTVFSFVVLLVLYLVAIRRKIYYLWLPLLIFFIMLRIMLTSEFFSVWQSLLFFNLSYEATNQLLYFVTFAVKYLLIYLLQEQCGITISKRAKVVFLVYYTVLYLIYLFTPIAIYNQHLSVLLPLLSYVLEFYLFVKVYSEINKLKNHGITAFVGAVVIIVGLSIDSYYINGLIYANMSIVMLVAFAIFALLMFWVYVMRSMDIYDDLIVSSSQLQLANMQLNIQKEYYNTLSEQMKEIYEIKHDIRHFTGVMSRLVHDKKYNDLQMLLQEYGSKTEMDMLPVFCDNNIANSIIGFYYLQAKDKGISFRSNCNVDKKVSISDSDICVILGNALENAVTASDKLPDSADKYIDIKIGKMNKQWLCMVKNSYHEAVNNKDGHYISTKKGNLHGLGLKNIEKVVSTYGGFVKIEHTDTEFTLMVSTPE